MSFFARAVADFDASQPLQVHQPEQDEESADSSSTVPQECISLQVGDFLVIEKTFGYPGYWFASLAHDLSKRGWAPCNYLKQIVTENIWGDDKADDEDDYKQDDDELARQFGGVTSWRKRQLLTDQDANQWLQEMRTTHQEAIQAAHRQLYSERALHQAFQTHSLGSNYDRLVEMLRSAQLGLSQVQHLRLGDEVVRTNSRIESPQLAELVKRFSQQWVGAPIRHRHLVERQFAFTEPLSREITEEHIVYAGYADLKTGLTKKWKRRFCVLYRHKIAMFHKPQDAKPLAVLFLNHPEHDYSKLELHEGCEGVPCFNLDSSGKESGRGAAWQLAVPDEPAEQNQWREALRYCRLFAMNRSLRLLGYLSAVLFQVPEKKAGKPAAKTEPRAFSHFGPMSLQEVEASAWVLANSDADPFVAVTCRQANLQSASVQRIMSAHLTQAQHTIRRLDFSSNRLGSFLPYGWLECTALQELILEQCGLEDRAIEVVANSHKRMMCPLLRLDLGHNRISDGGLAALIHLLDTCQHPKLEHLNLSHNLIGDVGVVAMSEFLCRPATQCLLYLDLCHNEPIGDRGAIALADALRLNKQLLSFNLSGCTRITSEGGRALTLMAQVNRSLQTLAFEDGSFSSIRLNQEGLSVLRLMYDYADGTDNFKQRLQKQSDGRVAEDPMSVFMTLIQDDLREEEQQRLHGLDEEEEEQGGYDYQEYDEADLGYYEDEDGGYAAEDFASVDHDANSGAPSPQTVETFVDPFAASFVDPFAEYKAPDADQPDKASMPQQPSPRLPPQGAPQSPPPPLTSSAQTQEQRRKNRTVFM